MNNTSRRLSRTGLASTFVLSLFLASPLIYAANTWNGAGGDSNWNNNANWTLGWVPTNGELVVINNANVILTNDTADLGGLTVTNGARLHVYAGLTNGVSPDYGLLVSVSGTLYVASNSWIYPHSHNTNGGSPFFRCTNLVVAAFGGFNANTNGYDGGPNGAHFRGYGPGGGSGNSSPAGAGGGGYGGRGGPGGQSGNGAAGGSAYGSYTAPLDPGSGGGSSYAGAGYIAGAGGGLIRVLATDSVVVDGSLLANGGSVGNTYSGPGSGGGIYIECRTFAGTGVVTAIGGDGNFYPGGGGGGRIAVVYDMTAQAGVSPKPAVTFNAAGGNANYSGMTVLTVRQKRGRPGSLYLSDTNFFDLARIQGGEIMVPGLSSWTTNTLVVSNGLIAFPAGFNLTISQDVNLTAAGGIELSNSVVNIGRDLIMNSDRRSSADFRGGPNQQISIGANISITKGRLDVDHQGATNPALSVPGTIALDDAYVFFYAHATNASSLNVAGNVSATNGSAVYLYSGMTNGPPGYGLLLGVTGDVTIASNCWVYPYSHSTNGGSVLFRVANLIVNAAGGIDATARGFAGSTNVGGSFGYGPGSSPGTATGTGGAGYGGSGASGWINSEEQVTPGGPTYGSYTNPINPGSGAGGSSSYHDYRDLGGAGGGLIRVLATNSVIVDGSLLANGENTSVYGGSGSGGGIYIQCSTFKGTGLLKAAGGDYSGARGGCGGGGRIAVLYDTLAQAGVSSQPTVVFNAAGGSHTQAGRTIPTVRQKRGRPGSLYLSDNQFFDLARIQGGEIMVPGVSSWTMTSLAVTGGLILFPTGFSLTVSQDMNLSAVGGIDLSNSVVNIGRDLIITSDRGSSAIFRGGPSQQISIGRDLSLDKSCLEVYVQGTTNTSVSVGGSITLTNGALAYLYSGMTNGAAAYGMLVNVVGNMTIASNCWIYPYSHNTNGGSVHFQAANVTVNGGGGIDATAGGYRGGYQDLDANGLGQGYGGGGALGTAGRGPGGGGYGGMGAAGGTGGTGPHRPGGSTCGSSNNPVDPGSGGGGVKAYFNTADYGTTGGGLVHMLATGTVLVDGSLLANGGDAAAYTACGSGGGINVQCRTFAGSGLLKADGGKNSNGGDLCGGSGGGGRIAVWSLKPTNNWTGVAQANGGVGAYAGNIGTNGTIFWGRVRDKGTVFVVR